MKKNLKVMFIFLVGCVSYGMIEILFRGFTHWSMVLTGGACLVSLYYISGACNNELLDSVDERVEITKELHSGLLLDSS